MIGRRGFITGLISLVAAPAIVRAGSLMPIRSIVMPPNAINPWLGDWAEVQAFIMPWPPAFITDIGAFGTGVLRIEDGTAVHVPLAELHL